MNAYIVYAHPNPESFNHAILDNVKKSLEHAGHGFVVSDLYADGFDSVLSAEDLHGSLEGRVGDDVKAYQEKIAAADALVLIFPLWWFGPPAILKGWFDRVFSKGFAYDFGPKGLVPMLKIKKALVLSTAGGMEPMYKNMGFADAISKVLVNGTLQFCGIWNVNHRIFHNVIDCDAMCRSGYLQEAYDLAGRLF